MHREIVDEQFQALFYTHYKRLCQVAHRYVANTDACEDIVQECFVKLWERRHQVKSDNIAGYLSVAVRNSAISYWRQANATIMVSGENAEMELAQQKVEDELEQNDRSVDEIVAEALNELPERCRIIFTMSRFDKKTYKEIADELKLSVKTVENQMGKAIKLMRAFALKHPHYFIFILYLLQS